MIMQEIKKRLLQYYKEENSKYKEIKDVLIHCENCNKLLIKGDTKELKIGNEKFKVCNNCFKLC